MSIHVFLLIALVRRVSNPVCDNPQSIGDVLGSYAKVKIIKGTTFVKPNVINEVVITLPSASVIFDVICESSTFNKLMINFTVCKLRIVCLKI